MKKYQGRGGSCKDFQECLLQFQSSSSSLIIRAQGYPLPVHVSITGNSERQLINEFFSFVFQPQEELVVTVFVFHAGTSVSGK